MDGQGALFGHVKGKYRKVLRQVSVDLPNKHRRGGQSANRFARLRDQARQAYVRKVAENCSTLFISDCRPNVKGLVFAGCADFKNDLLKSKVLDKRLGNIVVASVDLAYGGHRGFDEAVDRSAETLGNLELTRENKILGRFFDQVGKDSDLCCFAIGRETVAALEMGAVEDLILWEDLEARAVTHRDPANGNETTTFEAGAVSTGTDSESGEPLVQWLCEHHNEFGCRLHLVSGCSTLGSQFVGGFGGVGGILRFPAPSPSEDVHDCDVIRTVGDDDSSASGDCSENGSYGFDDGDFAF